MHPLNRQVSVRRKAPKGSSRSVLLWLNTYIKFVVLTLSGLLICVITHAQDTDVSMSVTTVQEQPMISVSNMRALSVEAFLVTVDIARTNRPLTRIYYDVYVNYKHDAPIPPGASKQVPLPRVVGQDLPVPTLRAVVFSDGTSLGEDAWVHELLHMRKILSTHIEEVMALLQNATDHNLTREETLKILQEAEQASRKATPSATLEERVRHDQTFYMAIRNLEATHANGKVPDTPRLLKGLRHVLNNWLIDLQAAKPPLSLGPEGQN